MPLIPFSDFLIVRHALLCLRLEFLLMCYWMHFRCFLEPHEIRIQRFGGHTSYAASFKFLWNKKTNKQTHNSNEKWWLNWNLYLVSSLRNKNYLFSNETGAFYVCMCARPNQLNYTFTNFCILDINSQIVELKWSRTKFYRNKNSNRKKRNDSIMCNTYV